MKDSYEKQFSPLYKILKRFGFKDPDYEREAYLRHIGEIIELRELKTLDSKTKIPEKGLPEKMN